MTAPANNRSPSDPQGIAPAAFVPLTAPVKARRQLHPVAVAVIIALLLAAVVLWFLLSARAVFFDTAPADSKVSVAGSFVFQLSDSYLMHPGRYQVSATADGYFPYRQEVEVTDTDSQRFAIEMVKKPGHLELSSTPDGATILLNGVAQGQTPMRLSELAPGSHQLQLQLPRYFEHRTSVEIEGLDNTQPLHVELNPAWGELSINSSPAGAEVLVDGQPRGLTPLTTELLARGETVKLQLAGHKSWQRSLKVSAGEQLKMDTVVLEKVDGLLRLASRPSGASVTIDGTFRGRTPLELALKPGQPHRLSLFLNGYLTAKRSITIPSGSERQLDVALTSETGQLRVETKPIGAQVYIDGVARGTNGESFALPSRPHTIQVRAKGYASQQQVFTPRPGIEQVVQFSLLTESEARWAATPREITTQLGQKLKLFKPETSFTMGASRREPGRRANEIQREVTLKRPFYMATHEVTNTQFKKFSRSHSSRQSGGVSLSLPQQPVVNVSWQQAALFCNWLSAREGLPLFYQTTNDQITDINPKATGYRLPTEAEWAWSARQLYGNMLKFEWGESFPPEGGAGNYADKASAKINSRVVKGYNDGYPVTSPVGKFEPNSKGLYDMGGNVAEWVNDYYGIEINLSGRTQLDPHGPDTGEFRVIRGASWRHGSIAELRLSFRDYGKEPRDDLGFRIARYVE